MPGKPSLSKVPETYVWSKYCTKGSNPIGILAFKYCIPALTRLPGRKASPSSIPQNNFISSSLMYTCDRPSSCIFLPRTLTQMKETFALRTFNRGFGIQILCFSRQSFQTLVTWIKLLSRELSVLNVAIKKKDSRNIA